MNKIIENNKNFTFSFNYAYLLTTLFFITSFIGILNHEVWLDEAHHWLLARDSNSFLELIHNTRYEGHPILWNISLYIMSWFTHNVFWIQFLNITIATITIFIFLKKAPFNILFKVLFIFGYFMLFEYTQLSRNYMLGVLFLFLAMRFYKERNQKFITFSLLLTFASNVHLIFLVIASVIILFSFLEQFKANTLSKKNHIWGYILFAIGFLLVIIQITPPTDSTFFNDINNLSFIERILKGFIAPWNALVCIPDFRSIHFWNTNIFINISKPFTATLGLLIYLLPFLLFYKNKKILYYIYTSLFAAQLFFFITQRGNARSEGMIYIVFIIGLWMEKYSIQNPIKFISNIKNIEKYKQIAIYSILCIHFLSGIVSYSMDMKYSFTPSKEIAGFLHTNYKDKTIITDFFDAPLSSYLDTQIYSLCTQKFESYSRWGVTCNSDTLYSNKKTNSPLSDFLVNKNSNCIFITLNPILNIPISFDKWSIINKGVQIKLLKKVGKSIVKNRDYYIYEVKPILN